LGNKIDEHIRVATNVVESAEVCVPGMCEQRSKHNSISKSYQDNGLYD
jgi:hypothetical protein